MDRRGDLRDLLEDRASRRDDLRELLKDRGDRRGDLRELILDRLQDSDGDSPVLSRIRDRIGDND